MTSTTTSVPPRLDYHRQAWRAVRPRWWRPLAVLAVTAGLYLAGILILVVVPLAVLALAVPGLEESVDRAFTSSDVSDPLAATFLLLSIAALLPAALLAVRLVGGRGARTLSSVAGGLRRRLLARCLGLALLLCVPLAVLAVITAGDGAQHAAVTERTLPLVAIALLVVPLQAAAEEYVFRGLLMQTVGAWLRHPAFAIVLPVPLFTFGHEYDALGMIDVASFGLVAGWLAWRTGGLEAAIALHVVNNAVLVGLGAFGLVDLAAAEGTATGLACSLAFMGCYAWLVRTWGDPPKHDAGRPAPNRPDHLPAFAGATGKNGAHGTAQQAGTAP